MKKTYIAPQTLIHVATAIKILAASALNHNYDEQDVTLTDEKYDGEFAVKECEFDW